MAVEQTGLEFVAENISNFLNATGDASNAVTGFVDVGAMAADSYSAVEEIITGALRHIGEIAVDSLLQASQAVKEFAMGSIEEALDAEKNLASLNAVIKSTGGAAGVTAEDAQELAMRFRDLAGGSDDAVLAIEQVALRAGNISKDELPDFIQHTLDLAEVMGSAESAATLLARSEEDPVSAMGKAQRAGIVFNQTLKEQIKQLQKDGKLKEANALFTNRLAEATSGLAASAAETTSGKWEILTGHFKEFQEVVGTAVIPILNDLMDRFLKPAMPFIEDLSNSLAKAISQFESFISTGNWENIDNIASIVAGVIANIFGLDAREVESVLFKITGALGNLSDWIISDVIPALFQFSDWIQAVGLPALFALGDWFTNVALPAIQPVIDALGQIFDSFKNNDPDAFTAALDKLFAAFNGLWERYLQPALTEMWNKFSAWIVEQAGIIKDEFFNHWRPAIVDWLDEVTPPFLDKLGEFIGAGIAWLLTTGIPDFVGNLIDGIQYMLGLKQPDIEEAGSSFFSGLARGFSADAGWAKIQETMDQLNLIITLGLLRASEAAQAILVGIGQIIGVSFVHAVDIAMDSIGRFVHLGDQIIGGIIQGMNNQAQNLYDVVTGMASGVRDRISQFFNMGSPSRLMEDMFGLVMEGGIIGIQNKSGAMENAATESMVTPVMTAASMASGVAGSSRTNNWNLNVNSSQSSQGVIGDFTIMQAMAG